MLTRTQADVMVAGVATTVQCDGPTCKQTVRLARAVGLHSPELHGWLLVRIVRIDQQKGAQDTQGHYCSHPCLIDHLLLAQGQEHRTEVRS